MFEYDPPYISGGNNSYPVVVLVHGGGFHSGSPTGVADIAYELSQGTQFYRDDNLAAQSVTLTQKFIVMTIEYRLACNVNDSNIPSGFLALCGWTYQTTDGMDTRPGGAAIHDVEDAITWVRDNYQATGGWAPGNGVTWDTSHTVVAMGESSGASLVYSAAALGTNGDTAPDAVAGWSGPLEFQQMGNGYYGCDVADPNDPNNDKGQSAKRACWLSTNNYLDCHHQGEPDDGPISDCVGSGQLYETASPITDYGYRHGPPIFFANGGGPDSGIGTDSDPELIGLQESLDFRDAFPSSGTITPHERCVVDLPKHASTYLHKHCETLTNTVLAEAVSFVDSHIP